MKKLLFFFASILIFQAVAAQDIVVNNGTFLYKGGKLYCNGSEIKWSEYESITGVYCPLAAQQLERSNRNRRKSLAFGCVASTLFVVGSVFISFDSNGLGTFLGLCNIYASFPFALLSIGYGGAVGMRRKQSLDTFNNSVGRDFSASIGFGATSNGIGLVMTF